MKKLLKSAAGIALGAGLLFSIQPVKAQIYNEFKPAYTVVKSYAPLDPSDTLVNEIKAKNFYKWTQNDLTTIDRNDGFAKIDINLKNGFQFAGKTYFSMWINVNGFVVFEQPGLSREYTQNPSTLFNSSVKLEPIIAPYWGNHAYRDPFENTDVYPTGDMIPSQVGVPFKQSHVYVKNTEDMLVVEWNNLNININEPDNIPYQSSIANFQLRLYKSKHSDITSQGDIEFCYGSIGETGGIGGTVRQEGAVVGLRGNMKGVANNQPDYLNALNLNLANNYVPSTDLLSRTTIWPPTKHTDKRVYFEAIEKWHGDASTWGDGDADLSKTPYIQKFDANGNVTFVEGIHYKNYSNNQKRFVNTNDVRVILRSMVTGVKLDSNRFQVAYHADVNHNGRFFYTPSDVNPLNIETSPLVRKEFTEKTELDTSFVNDNGDFTVEFLRIGNDANRIYFQANENDAALILKYMAGKEITLPVWDNQITFKANANENATDIVLGDAVKNVNGTYSVPVYLNGATNEALGLSFDINGKVINVNSNTAIYESTNNKVVLASAQVSNNGPICVIEFASESDMLNISNIRLNDENKDSKSLKLSSSENITSSISVSNNNSLLNVVVEKGNYEVSIFDILGNRVASVFNGSFNDGSNSLPLNLDLNSGVYFIRVIGENSNLSTKIQVSK